MLKHFFLFLGYFAFSVVVVHAQQSREDLQKQEQELKKELADLTKMLNETQKSKKLSISQLTIIKKKITKRGELINSISRQIKDLDNTIFINERDIYRLRKELDTLRVKYTQSIVFAYKNRSSYEYLNFLFSSQSFNDAIKRITYLKSYRHNRETQAEAIVQSENLLKNKISVLGNYKKDRQVTLLSQSEQLKVLQEDKKEQDQVVAQLKGKEQELAKQITAKEKQRERMQLALKAIIRREIDDAARREKALKQKQADDAKKVGNKVIESAKNNSVSVAKSKNETIATTERPYTPFESTPEGRETSINFEKNRGQLPWPVDKGNVYIRFGTETVPGTKLKRNSDGIEVALPEGSPVKSIADGKVSYVSEVNGELVVFVRHGKYFTCYGYLSSVNVSSGQEVKAGSILGRSGTSIDGEGALRFMINNDKGTPLNPELWLKQRR